MKELQLRIVSPEKTLFDGKALIVKLPGTEGAFSILSGHAPLLSSLKSGEIVYQVEKGSHIHIPITSGFIEVDHNIVTVCVE
ncbi:MAG: synthase subunit epsilon [Bacteroidota bacterium]|jgi:F-type H+-transporting ATPase subunit epsilon